MSKKLSKLIIALVVVLVVLTGCSTTIALNTLVPAKVDVGGYKTIAVMSTQDNARWTRPSFWNSAVPFNSAVDPFYFLSLSLMSGLDFGASGTIVDAATDMITKAVDTGISYKVIPPSLTDAYITVGKSNGNLRKTLMDNGVDAILKTEITYLYYDEYISQDTDWLSSKDKSGKTYYKKRFYFVQQYGISISYTLTDVENNRVYTHVDELGTYCLMDMEKWFASLDVKVDEFKTDSTSMDTLSEISSSRTMTMNKLSCIKSNSEDKEENQVIDVVFLMYVDEGKYN